MRVRVLQGPNYPGYDARKSTGCVGIINQGATCYLNSLLQTLYHVPAFRKAVYRIPTREDEDARSSIAVSMQRLFYYLQHGDHAQSTSDLTHAFGWDSFEAFQQHDVQVKRSYPHPVTLTHTLSPYPPFPNPHPHPHPHPNPGASAGPDGRAGEGHGEYASGEGLEPLDGGENVQLREVQARGLHERAARDLPRSTIEREGV